MNESLVAAKDTETKTHLLEKKKAILQTSFFASGDFFDQNFHTLETIVPLCSFLRTNVHSCEIISEDQKHYEQTIYFSHLTLFNFDLNIKTFVPERQRHGLQFSYLAIAELKHLKA